MYLPYIPLILFLFQQLRNEYDGISPDPGGTNRGFPGTSGPPRSEESCGNLQHISGNLEKTNYHTAWYPSDRTITSLCQPWFDMKLFVDFWKFTKIWKGLRHRNTELFLFWLLDVQNNSMFSTSKQVKNQKSTNNFMSNHGWHIEVIVLSDGDLAVLFIRLR